MGKNQYLNQRRAVEQAFLDAGEEMGMQKMWDYMQLALRCPDVMGKDILGRERLERVFRKCQELANYYHTAFTNDVEADYRKEELDGQLAEIWGGDLSPFYERYPKLKKQTYKKAKKGWK